MRRKILVVDDDGDTLELLQFSLKKAGFAVGTAHDGVEALRKVCSLSPDVILLDLMMPEIDGLGVCEMLRSNPATAGIPIIMLTAVTSNLVRMAALEAGVDDYLTKPFSPKNVVAKVDDLLKASSRT
jgi:DNA-binding response OmpR family regulator